MLSSHWLSPHDLLLKAWYHLTLYEPFSIRLNYLFGIRHSDSQAVLLIISLSAFRLQFLFLLPSLLSLVHTVNSICLKAGLAFPSRVAAFLLLLFILWVMSLKKKKISPSWAFPCLFFYICNEILTLVLRQKQFTCHVVWDNSQPLSGISKSPNSVVLHSASWWSSCWFHSELKIPVSYQFSDPALVS